MIGENFANSPFPTATRSRRRTSARSPSCTFGR